MTRIISILAKIMLFKILALILLQGVLTTDDTSVKSESGRGKVQQSDGLFDSGESVHLQQSAAAKSRSKRCTCYSYKDKECVYYCHLDIIWINTPERTVPYGMSSYRGPQRIRRAVIEQSTNSGSGEKNGRCFCSHEEDSKCQGFCTSRALKTKPPRNLHRVVGPG